MSVILPQEEVLTIEGRDMKPEKKQPKKGRSEGKIKCPECDYATDRRFDMKK